MREEKWLCTFLLLFNSTMQIFNSLFPWTSVFLSLCLTSYVHSLSSDGAVAESELFRTINALKGILGFFARNYKQVNLDAVIGTRMVDGQLKVLLRRLDASGVALRPDYWEAVKELQLAAEQISDAAIPYIAKNAPAYYGKIGVILDRGFWEVDAASRDLDPTLVVPPRGQGEAMHEEDSDDCLAEFFGTGSHTSVPCTISDRCWLLMTQPGYRGYSLSHQVFYLEIGKQFGCVAQMAEKAELHRQPSLDGLSASFCVNMLTEAKQISDSGFPADKQDLFMEQAALCGMLGYRQFFTADWLDTILGWQDHSGCYVIQPGEFGTPLIDRSKFKRSRVKREEKSLAHGCLCHRTTVAAGAIAEYIRYIIEFLTSPLAV